MSKSNDVSIFDIKKQKKIIQLRASKQEYYAKRQMTKLEPHLYEYQSLRSDIKLYRIIYKGITCSNVKTFEVAKKILEAFKISLQNIEPQRTDDGELLSCTVICKEAVEQHIQKIMFANKRTVYVVRMAINKRNMSERCSTLEEAKEVKKDMLKKRAIVRDLKKHGLSTHYDAIYTRQVLKSKNVDKHISRTTNTNTDHVSFKTTIPRNKKNKHILKLNKTFPTVEEAIVYRDSILSQYISLKEANDSNN